MNRTRLPIVAFLLACWVPVPAGIAQEKFYQPALAAKDIELALGTDWYGVYLKDKKIGNCKIEHARDGDNLVEKLAMTMKLTAFNKKTEMNISQVQVFEAKPPYRLLKVVKEQTDGAFATSITATRTDKGFDYAIVAPGQRKVVQKAELHFNLADDMAADIWLRSGPKVGDNIRIRDLDVEDWGIEPVTHTVKAVKTALVAGVEVKYYEVETESIKDNVKYLSRFDIAGKALSMNFAIFELRKESEKEARNTEFGHDLFVLGMVKIDQPIGFTTTLRGVELEVVGNEKFHIPDGPRQTIVVENGKQIIKLGKKYGKEFKATEKDLEENLKETNTYLIDDPKIKEMAAKAVGDATAPKEKVKRIVAYVSRFVIPTNSASIPNIPDLLKNKKGDCKSYALLTTTLCRAAGVPSREVAGLLYMGDDQKAFGGHAWNEVVLDGAWVPVDASLNQTDLDAGHISFGEQRQAGGAMMQSLGKLTLKVVDSQSSK